MMIDLLPTIARLAGAEVPNGIDGKDIWPLISGEPGARSPHAALLFYWGRELQGVRSGKWKLHFPHGYQSLDTPGSGGEPGHYAQRRIGSELFDLKADPGELKNIANEHPDIVRRLEGFAEEARHDLGDSATKRQGAGVREPGRL